MKKLFYFCKLGALLIILMWLDAGCQDAFWLEREGLSDNTLVGLSIRDARTFFEKEIMGDATRAVLSDSAFLKKKFMLPIGDFVPKWSEGVSTANKSLYSVDIPIESSCKYRVIQRDAVTGQKMAVQCYHKLVVIKDPQTEVMGSYIVFFIATNEFTKAHKGDISKCYNNDGNMGDFSGLKIYTTLEGLILRANKYEGGKKIDGIYLGQVSDIKTYASKLACVLYMMRNMTLQQGVRKGPMTRSMEDDNPWGWDNDPWGNSGNNENDDWIFGNGGDYSSLGGGFFYDSNNDSILYDWDGDGNPDSVWVPEVDITPDYPSDNIFPDPDPDPTPDPVEPRPDPRPEPGSGTTIPNIQPSIKKTKAEIKTATANAVKAVIAKFGSTKAYCNVGVSTAFNNLFKSNDLSGMCANDVVKYWRNHSGNWEKISLSQAQDLANQGYFVVAGWINSNGSGHVVVIVPGEATQSSSWHTKVPCSMDTGANMRSSSQPLSKSFSYKKKDNIEYYKYK